MPPEVSACGGSSCPALAWLPAATLARLTALEDGAYVVANPHACTLATGHTSDHLALVQTAGETGHWATWTLPVSPVSVAAAAFCPASWPAPDPGDSLYCHLPTGHDGPHDPGPPHGDGLTTRNPDHLDQR